MLWKTAVFVRFIMWQHTYICNRNIPCARYNTKQQYSLYIRIQDQELMWLWGFANDSVWILNESCGIINSKHKYCYYTNYNITCYLNTKHLYIFHYIKVPILMHMEWKHTHFFISLLKVCAEMYTRNHPILPLFNFNNDLISLYHWLC